MLSGTDISAYQSSTVPAGSFVILKATQGTGYVNSKLRAQLADARRKGMLVAFYHFPEFGNDPLDDARHFSSVVVPLLQPGDNVILDHETYPPPSADHAAAWGREFLAAADEQCARRPWVYANVDWATHGYCDGMGAYPYWCADPSSAIGHPRVRGPFTTWVAHQYSEAGGIDHDVFNGSAADWRALGQPHQEDDMAQVSSLGVDGKQTIAAGKNSDLKFTKEFSDKHGLHGDNGTSVVIATDKYWAHVDATFRLSGLTPGATLDVAWTRVKDDGTFIDDAWRLPFTADKDGIITGQLNSQFGVDATNRLRVRVYNTSDKAATVVATVDGRPVTMAKASLFSY